MGVSQGGESEFSPLGRRPRGVPEQAKFIWEKYPGRKPGDFYFSELLWFLMLSINKLTFFDDMMLTPHG